MDAGIERLSQDDHAYGLAVGGRLVAHVWWDADPARRAALGWYVRDLRTPGHVRRLEIGDGSIEMLAADEELGADDWEESADSAARLTTAHALRRARAAVREGPGERYELYVEGIAADWLDSAFPDVERRQRNGRQLLAGRLTPPEVSAMLRRIRSMGGTTIAVVRVD